MSAVQGHQYANHQILAPFESIENDCLGKIMSYLATHEDLLSFRLISRKMYSIFKTSTERGQILSFTAKNATDDGLWVLEGFMNLTNLDLSHCRKITARGFEHFKTVIPKTLPIQYKELPIQYLNLSYCKSINDTALGYLQNMPLRSLDLTCCKNITDKGLALLKELPIETLIVAFCANISDAGMQNLRAMPLRELSLFYCVKITDVGISSLQQLPFLMSLDIRWCDKVTDKSLGLLYKLSLQHIDLSKSTGLSVSYRKVWDANALIDYRNKNPQAIENCEKSL